MAATTKIWSNGLAPTCEDVDLNGFKDENNNLIVGSGQALNTGDNQQTHKAVAHYAATGDFYVDSGAADAYVLSVTGVQVAPPTYATGMRIRFEAGNSNTGASTVNVAGLGVKAIKDSAGDALTANSLQAGFNYEAEYDGVDFILQSKVLLTSDGWDFNGESFSGPINVQGTESVAGTVVGSILMQVNAAHGDLTKVVLPGDVITLTGGAGADAPVTVAKTSWNGTISQFDFVAAAPATDYTHATVPSYRADTGSDLTDRDYVDHMAELVTFDTITNGDIVVGTGKQGADQTFTINRAVFPNADVVWIKVKTGGSGTTETIKVYEFGKAHTDSFEYFCDRNDGYTDIIPIRLDSQGRFLMRWTQFATNIVTAYIMAYTRY